MACWRAGVLFVRACAHLCWHGPECEPQVVIVAPGMCVPTKRVVLFVCTCMCPRVGVFMCMCALPCECAGLSLCRVGPSVFWCVSISTCSPVIFARVHVPRVCSCSCLRGCAPGVGVFTGRCVCHLCVWVCVGVRVCPLCDWLLMCGSSLVMCPCVQVCAWCVGV